MALLKIVREVREKRPCFVDHINMYFKKIVHLLTTIKLCFIKKSYQLTRAFVSIDPSPQKVPPPIDVPAILS